MLIGGRVTPLSQAATAFHYCHILRLLSRHLAVMAPPTRRGLFNGRGSQAWGRASRRLRRDGAGRQCEPRSPGPGEGSP